MVTRRELHFFDYVNRPFTAVRDALRSDPLGLFTRATAGAAKRAHALVTTLRAGMGGLEIGRDVVVEILGIHDGRDPMFGEKVTFDLVWRAERSPGLFPAMRAELDVYALSPGETQLDFRGSYTPPLGAVGQALDAIVLGKVAEACVHRFVSDLASHLRAEVPEARRAPSPSG
jgi:hypothetical protein